MRELYRILDANFNRAREALRVAEDCGRFALNDPAITSMAKHMRSDLKGVLETMPFQEMLTSRDTAGDIGTELTSPSEPARTDLPDVAAAACKRLSEALRTIEEYSKVVAPEQTTLLERMRYNAYTLEQRVMSRLATAQRCESVRIYVLVSAEICKGSLLRCARSAVAGGADVIQLREKRPEIGDAQLLAMAAELRELTDETGRMLIINDRADIAALVGADGVHLGQYDLPVSEARRLLRPAAIVGKSTHSIEQARSAVNEGADYVSVGPMFQTDTKDAGPLAGPELLKQAVHEIGLPVVPIGGINADNVNQLIDAGAQRVAVCSAVCASEDPRGAAEQIRAAFPT